MPCDGCIRGNSPFPIYAIFEVENELASTSTLKDFQGLAYYSRFCIVGKESTAYLFSTCPAFLIELRGPHIRVTAMTYQDQVTASFLTCVENIVHSNSMRLASVFKALKLGLDSLETFYDSIQGKAEGSKRLPFLDKFAPYSLWLNPNYKFKNSIGNKQLVFLAEDANKREVVIKFCRRYGDRVHRAWYDMGYAPELLEFQRLAGGFYLVAMEFLGDPWKTFLLLDDQEKTECRSVVLDALKKVHGLSVFGPENAGSVHGDAREGNIMVRRRNGVFEVKFIDFDWAGQHGVSTYPPKMNHVQIAWPDGVSDGMPMQQRHDVHIVSNPPGASSYSWRRHV
ncbi:hypothetical protein M758_10G133400 [Ceratodon purpureus]|nr:hypothetical protein M758_10G133400 [Ceratodon purpureus]